MKLRVLALLAVLAAATAGSARATTTLIVTGHGWGHGVGMSQWGAFGYALHGWRYERILAHYYPGTKLAHEGEPRVRVLLEQGASVVTVGCATQLTVTDGRRFVGHLPAKTYGVSAALAIPVRHRAGTRPFNRGVALFSCARGLLSLDGRPYQGTLCLRRNGKTLTVINGLKLDQYVRGVVPSESPARWPLAELEAQAVAARSYAVAKLNPSATYDLVSDTRDQVYGGIAAEHPRSNLAVQKTKGEILTYDGEVARTFYSSSSGGRTEAVQDAWPGAAPVPYLRSVPDPYDTYSPHHDWGPFVYSASRLGALLGLSGPIEWAQIMRNSSERVSSTRLRLVSGKVESLSGEDVVHALGLRSTWFSIGELSVSTSAQRVVYGGSVRVVARAVAEKDALLQELSADGVWHTVQPVHDKAVLSVAPRVSTAFRLHVTGASGESVSVGVRPELRVEPLGRRLLGGEVLPRTAGPVQVWRRVGGVWKIVAHPRILPSGKFRTPLRLRPTVYRITAGDGAFAPVSRRLVITRRMLATMSR